MCSRSDEMCVYLITLELNLLLSQLLESLHQYRVMRVDISVLKYERYQPEILLQLLSGLNVKMTY